MSAFIPSTPSTTFRSSFTAGENVTLLSTRIARSVAHKKAIRMEATVPDSTGPATSKYLQFIPVDRLNKAPMITINAFKNPDYNTISVSCPTLPTDIPAGQSVRQSTKIDDGMFSPPAPMKYSKYYPVDSVNEAPIISLHQTASMTPDKWAVSCVMTTIPTNIEQAKSILGDNNATPDPQLYEAYVKDNRLNKAPMLLIVPPEDNYDAEQKGYISIESENMPLNSYGADLILQTYRK